MNCVDFEKQGQIISLILLTIISCKGGRCEDKNTSSSLHVTEQRKTFQMKFALPGVCPGGKAQKKLRLRHWPALSRH
jgi:hypothetical protein